MTKNKNLNTEATETTLVTDSAVAVAELTETETSVPKKTETPTPTPPTVVSEDFITRIERIASSSLAGKLRGMMKPNQHYIMVQQDGREAMNLTRDGWSLVAAMFQINLSVVEESINDLFDYPDHYTLLKGAYERNLDRWISGELPEEGGKRLKDVQDKMTSIYNMEIRPSRRSSMRVRVRAEFVPQNPGDALYYREEVGIDITAPGDVRSEFFKLTTRTCNRAIRNLIGGVCGDLVGADEDVSATTSRKPR